MQDSGPIMLIRHAEKAVDGELGVDRRGHADPQSLSVTGWMRAAGLAQLFAGVGNGNGNGAGAAAGHLARPMHLIAAGATADHPSRRAHDTLQPTAQALGLPIDGRFGADTTAAVLAVYLRSLQGPVLVCWPHAGLPALADALLQRTAAPPRWPDRSFDMVWVVQQSRVSWELLQVPQRLLPGDATHGRRRVAARR